MRAVRALLAAPVVGALCLFACNALNGVGELIPTDGDAGGNDAQTDVAPACACAPAAPPDWKGPLALFETSEGAPPACPSDLALSFRGNADLKAPAACAPCSCAPPDGGACPSIAVTTSTTLLGGCNPNNPCENVALTTTCAKVHYCSSEMSAFVDAGARPANGGSCAPDGGGPLPPTWQRAVVGCALTATSPACAPDQACIGASAVAAGARTCIVHPGDVPCPAGAYGARAVYYAKVRDLRACTPCTCDPPIGSACTGETVTLYSDNNCTAGAQPVPMDGTCRTFTVQSPAGSGMITAPATITGGACAPRAAQPSGSDASPDDPTTACCMR